MRYWSAPRPRASAESTACAVAWVLPWAVTPPAPSRARPAHSLAARACWRSASGPPAASGALRILRVPTGGPVVPGISVPPVNSIEFTGGTLIQVTTVQPVGTGKIRSALDAAGVRDAEIQQFGASNEYVVRARLGAGEIGRAHV